MERDRLEDLDVDNSIIIKWKSMNKMGFFGLN